MANWYGTARSNYFRVKDEQAFRAAFANLEVEIATDAEGRFALLCGTELGSWPSWIPGDDNESDTEIDVFEMVAEHLVDGDVAVLMEVGAEKMRYVTGYAVAVNSRNDQRVVSLDSIYTVALELGENVSQAAY
jgi:hypothetical protein